VDERLNSQEGRIRQVGGGGDRDFVYQVGDSEVNGMAAEAIGREVLSDGVPGG
jgi:hypothetical protein